MPNQGRNNDIDQAAEPLTTDSIKVRTGVRIGALAANTGTVYVGLNFPTVAADTGIQLAAGTSQSFDVGTFNDAPGEYGDLADIYVIGSADNQGVWYYYS